MHCLYFICERKFYARKKLRDTGNQPLGLFSITFMLQIKKRAGVGGGGGGVTPYNGLCGHAKKIILKAATFSIKNGI